MVTLMISTNDGLMHFFEYSASKFLCSADRSWPFDWLIDYLAKCCI